MQADGINFIGDMQPVALGPDDVLVLSVDQHLSDHAIEHLTLRMQSEFPGRKVLVLGKGMFLGVLSPDAQSTATRLQRMEDILITLVESLVDEDDAPEEITLDGGRAPGERDGRQPL